MSRVFMSHNNGDDAFVDKLVADLNQRGIQTFADHRDIPKIARWNEHVQGALSDCKQMIAVVSERSVVSKNCQDEWHTFMNDGLELIPAWLSGDRMYFAFQTALRVDFRKEADYPKALKQLVEMLTDTKIQQIAPDPKREPPAVRVPGMLPSALGAIYPLLRRPEKSIGIATGNIGQIGGADVLVNSENDHLEMDRPIGKTISGSLNAFSADWDEHENPIRQTVKEELTAIAKTLTLPVSPATVLVTSAGNLRSNNVRHIVHAVSVVRHRNDFTPSTRIQLRRCATNVLRCVDALNRDHYPDDPLRRIVMPFFGAGDGGFPLDQVAPSLIECATDYLETQDTRIETVYFLAFRESTRVIVESTLAAIPDLDKPTLPG